MWSPFYAHFPERGRPPNRGQVQTSFGFSSGASAKSSRIRCRIQSPVSVSTAAAFLEGSMARRSLISPRAQTTSLLTPHILSRSAVIKGSTAPKSAIFLRASAAAPRVFQSGLQGSLLADSRILDSWRAPLHSSSACGPSDRHHAELRIIRQLTVRTVAAMAPHTVPSVGRDRTIS